MTTPDTPQIKAPICRECPFFDRVQVASKDRSNANYMLLGDFPPMSSRATDPPISGRRSVVLSTALMRCHQLYKAEGPEGLERWRSLVPYQMNAVQCVSDKKPTKEPTNRCLTLLHQTLVTVQPKVIIVFGATAFNALGMAQTKFSAVRGAFQKYVVDTGNKSETFYVMPTYSLDAVMAQPGIYDDMVRDMMAAFAVVEGRSQATHDIEDVIKDYVLPKTVEEIEALVDHVVGYAREGKDPDNHVIGLDTETSALEMYDPEAKMIALSVAWDTGKASAFLVDHPKAQWTEEERSRVLAAARRLCECPKPKALHNEKFDRQVIAGRYGWELNNVIWDTMGGEHLLEEDKKGQYGLKVLTRTRLPQYANYDDKVDEIRKQHGGLGRAAEAKRIVKALRKYEESLETYIPQRDVYLAQLDVYEQHLKVWDEARVAERTRARKEKRRMSKEAYGPKPKKPRKPKEPEKPQPKPPFDFTIIPVDDLVRYAAIDADVCRQHVAHQRQRMQEEYVQDCALRARYKNADPPHRVRDLMTRHVIPVSRELAHMEFTGFPVDLEYLEGVDSKLARVAEETAQKIYQQAGEFVIGNPKEVIGVLFNRGFREEGSDKQIVVPVNDDLRRTRTGQIKADEKALVYVHKQYGYEFPKLILQYRKATKARNPFLVNVREHAKLLDGRMHPAFHLAGTATGRLSSSNENMQNCLSGDTEILTENGWVRFDQLPEGLPVAQYNASTGGITFVVPEEYIAHACAPGALRQCTLQQVDLRGTEDHEQLVLRQTGKTAKVPLGQLRSGSKFIHAGTYVGGAQEQDPAWVTLLCAAQADGSWNGSRWDFSFAKPRKTERLRRALQQLGADYREGPRASKAQTRFYVTGPWAQAAADLLGAKKQFDAWLLEWSRHALDLFLDEVMLWDGGYTRGNCYSSSVEQNADWVQIVGLLSGRRARKRVYTAHGGAPNWQIDIPKKRKHSWTNHLEQEVVPGAVSVYCVRVPDGNIVVRRNGKAVITGNCPKKLAGENIKNIFVPPPGMTLINTDAKGAEVRLFAAYSNDQQLIDAICAGQDTHSFFTSQVWNDATYEEIEAARVLADAWYDAVNKGTPKPCSAEAFLRAEELVKRRTTCKRIVFGTLYGAMAPKIAETAGISLQEAQEVIDMMFKMFPSIPAYIQSTQNEVSRFHGVYTKTGRKRRFPLAKQRMFRSRAFRQAVNFKIQATSSDMVLWVLTQVGPIIREDLRGQLHATVHDSIVFSVPDAYVTQIPDLMHEYGTERVAKQFPWLPVPFIWDVEAGRRYGDVVSIEQYLKKDQQEQEQEQEQEQAASKKDLEDNDIVEGEDIREEINEELSL